MDRMSPNLNCLPEEVILQIFEFCDIQTLGRLARTCKYFKSLIHNDEQYIWRHRSRYVLGSNMSATPMFNRCKPNFSFKKRCELSKKWQAKLGTQRTILRYKRCTPWISLELNYLFCSKEEDLVQFPRDFDGNVVTYKASQIKGSYVDDISKFSTNDSEIVTAGRDGSLARWKKGDLQCIDMRNCHTSEVLTVDTKGDIIISGSKDMSLKIWKSHPCDTTCQKTVNMKIRVLSVGIMPSNRHFIVGLPGTQNIHPLQLFDLERGEYYTKFGDTFQVGAGILDIYPEFENTFLACGYDTSIRQWDIRCPQNCVAEWIDPYDNGIYCVRSDHNVTIVSGAYRNGLIHVWDKRWRSSKRLYHIYGYNSPVYAVGFDASHIYAAFDRATLQFSYI